MALHINGNTIETDDEGFLVDPTDWNRDVAQAIADELNIEMEESHWEVVEWVRAYYEQNQIVPEARHLLKALRERHGKERASRRYLYQLFPYGYGQQACRIAGTRKPLKLMLDV